MATRIQASLVAGQRLVVLAQAAAAPKPGEGPLHDPALGQHREARGRAAGLATISITDAGCRPAPRPAARPA